MKQQNENCRIVAIFCGWKPGKPNSKFPNGYLYMETAEISNDKVSEELPYSDDWNYFMAAWDYLRNSKYFNRESLSVKTIEKAVIDVNLDLAFKELVREIETINQSIYEDTDSN